MPDEPDPVRVQLESYTWRWAYRLLLELPQDRHGEARLPGLYRDWLIPPLYDALTGHPIEALNRPVGGKHHTLAQKQAIRATLEYVQMAKRGEILDATPSQTVREIFASPHGKGPLPAMTWRDLGRGVTRQAIC